MNVIWKELKRTSCGGGAEIELVFRPRDIVDSLEEDIVIGISLSRALRRSKQRD